MTVTLTVRRRVPRGLHDARQTRASTATLADVTSRRRCSRALPWSPQRAARRRSAAERTSCDRSVALILLATLVDPGQSRVAGCARGPTPARVGRDRRRRVVAVDDRPPGPRRRRPTASPTRRRIPPDASLAAEGGDPVPGQLGTFTWAGGGSDSPWLPGTPITVGAGESLTVTLDGGDDRVAATVTSCAGRRRRAASARWRPATDPAPSAWSIDRAAMDGRRDAAGRRELLRRSWY